MQKAQVITFSAPARYAEILKAMPNKSALIVEALDRYFIANNYGREAKIARQKQVKSRSKLKKAERPIDRHIAAFRASLPKDKRTITIEEIIKYKNEGRA